MHFSLNDQERFDRCLAALKASIEDVGGYQVTLYDSDVIQTLVDRWMTSIEGVYDTEKYRAPVVEEVAERQK